LNGTVVAGSKYVTVCGEKVFVIVDVKVRAELEGIGRAARSAEILTTFVVAEGPCPAEFVAKTRNS
jgi:hypothetical protein